MDELNMNLQATVLFGSFGTLLPEPQNSDVTTAQAEEALSPNADGEPNEPGNASDTSTPNEEEANPSDIAASTDAKKSMLTNVETPDALLKRLTGRLRLLLSDHNGVFQDFGAGRFGLVFGLAGPTEEDPINAVNVGLRLLRLAKSALKQAELRLVTVTGRIERQQLSETLAFDEQDEASTELPELLRHAYALSSDCGPGALYVDSLTFRMVRDAHHCRRVKNQERFSQSPLYEVQSGAGITNAGFEPSLVARDKELKRLMQTFQRVEGGQGPIFFTVTGDLGIGKSRLMRECIRRLKSRAVVFKNPRERRRIDRWKRTPYSYFGEILRSFFNVLENEDAASSREKLIKGVIRLLPRSYQGVPREMSHLIGFLCQVEFPESPFLADGVEEPTQLEKQAFSAFGRFLEEATQSKPIVFVLDDLYSADDSSIRLLRYLMQRLEPARFLFLLGSRLELLSKLEEESELRVPGERLVLQPLTKVESRLLLDELLPEGMMFPEPLKERILQLADGNPFFLRESLRELTEQALPETLTDSMLEKIDIPRSLEGILQARLFRLTSEQQHVLQRAAMFGRTFHRSGVEMLLRVEATFEPGWRVENGVIQERIDDAEEVLEELVLQGVIQHRSEALFEGESQFVFVPGLLQDLVLQEISKERRKKYHRLVAEWYESRAVDRLSDEVHAEIAFHYDQAGMPERAAEHHLQLATNAMKMFVVERSVRHLEKGLAQLGEQKPHLRQKGMQQLAEAYIIQGRYSQALEMFQKLLPLSWRVGHRVLAGQIYVRIGWVHFLKRDFESSLEALRNGHTLYQESHFPRGIAMALTHMGKVYTLMGDFKQAKLYLKEALDIRRSLGHIGELAWTLNDMGHLLFEQGDLEQAFVCHEEALELRQQLSHPMMIMRSMNNVALIHLAKGNHDAALDDLLASSDIAERVGENYSLAVIMVNLGELYLLRREPDQAERVLKRAMTCAQQLEDPLLKAECLRLKGRLLLFQEHPQKALEHAMEAYHLVSGKGLRSALTALYRLIGEIYAVMPDVGPEREFEPEEQSSFPSYLVGNALACFEESIALAHQDGNLNEESRSRYVLGEYEVKRGNIARGRYQLERAYESFGKLGMEGLRDKVWQILLDVDPGRRMSQFQLSAVSEEMLSSRSIGAVDKTIQFQVDFGDEDVAPSAPAVTQFPRRRNRVVSKPYFLPELEEFRQKQKAAKVESTQETDAPSAASPSVVSPAPRGGLRLPPVATLPSQTGASDAAKSLPVAVAQPSSTHPDAAASLSVEVSALAPFLSDDPPGDALPESASNDSGVSETASSPFRAEAKQVEPEKTPQVDEEAVQDPPTVQASAPEELQGWDEWRREMKAKKQTFKASDDASASLSPSSPSLPSAAPPMPGAPPVAASALSGEAAPTIAVRSPKPATPSRTPFAAKPPAVLSSDSEMLQGDSFDTISATTDDLDFDLSDEELAGGIDVDPALFSASAPKAKPSVYDSQVIIAQVAEDDNLSKEWFDEGRSDKSSDFWKQRKEELEEVHAEIIHEQVIEEIDGLNPNDKTNKTKKKS